ncbi:acyl-CoA dehydrogenase [Nocardioides sp.]|uniref:acyl-CoA dehydrogenase n=1 Tax=Nocardioides sp. TaxID=35761 RepID=UPI0037847A3D
MTLAITDDQRDLAHTAADLLARRGATAGARALLEADAEELPGWWPDAIALGWPGIHLPEEHGGAGATLEEPVLVVEQLGRVVAPGPFVPSAVVGAFLAASGHTDRLGDLAAGTATAGLGLGRGAEGSAVTVSGGRATGTVGPVLSGGQAALIAFPVADDVVVVDVGDGVRVTTRPNLDPTRRTAEVELDDVPCAVVAGGRRLLVDLARVLLSAEAVGVAGACTDMAAAYALQREQFGRPIGMFQAVKHHCADMLVATELATSAVWDAARAVATGGDQLTFAAAVAATTAADAADLATNLNTQVHGGIAMTWEHDAHLYVRRAGALRTFLRPAEAAADLTSLTAAGVSRVGGIELPPEAEPFRGEVRAFLAGVEGADDETLLAALIESGYVMPHWPRPYGREAGAIEQLVVEQEMRTAGVKRPGYGITAWVLLTLIQHGTPEQVERWIGPALRRELIWCQLFSEPAAGSDAAGVRTRAVPADDGWVVDGQKVWTTGAHEARYGLATVRTDPDAPKHRGITTMVIDLQAPGVTVRPLRMTNGQSDFNEVFLDQVFVPQTDVVGGINDGWTVARATLGNESVSIGGDQDTMSVPSSFLVALYEQHPERLTGGAARVGRYVALSQAMRMLNVRSAHRAVAGSEPGPEGAVTKLMLSELGHLAQSVLAELAGPDATYTDGDGGLASSLTLMHRAMSIAGGTSEIKRNQIAERILGLPRDPLVT